LIIWLSAVVALAVVVVIEVAAEVLVDLEPALDWLLQQARHTQLP
jgi:hypothetical protein